MRASITIAVALLVMAGMFVLTITLGVTMDRPQGKAYDCTVAEFHPDYPVDVKEACREIMKNRIKSERVLWI